MESRQHLLHHLQVQGAKRIVVARRDEHRGESHSFVEDPMSKFKAVLREQCVCCSEVLGENLLRRRGMVDMPPIVGRNRQETSHKLGIPLIDRDWLLVPELEVVSTDAKLEGVSAIQYLR